MSSLSCVRGYALVSVLYLVVLLTGVTAAYHAQARVAARVLTTTLHRAQAEALAEAGIWIAIHEHVAAATRAADHANRVTRAIDIDGTTVAVTVADVSGLINLNAAPPQLLAALLATRSGLDVAEQAAAVAAILDWRDSDSTRNPAGAEDADYEAAKASHGAKDAPFATVDELRLVLRMTPAAYRAIAPALTVFGTHARVNTAAAPPAVLAVLPRKPADADAGDDPYDQQFVQRTGENIYSVSATAAVADVTAQVFATIRYARGEQRAIQVLAWSDAPAAAALIEEPAGPRAR